MTLVLILITPPFAKNDLDLKSLIKLTAIKRIKSIRHAFKLLLH